MNTTTLTPRTVSDVDLVFPTDTRDFLPPYDTIPESFRRGREPLCDLVTRWFFQGLPGSTEFKPREGVDAKAALRHIRYCMGSFEPKHEHKEAGCAYLLATWFESVTVEGKAYAAVSPPARETRTQT